MGSKLCLYGFLVSINVFYSDLGEYQRRNTPFGFQVRCLVVRCFIRFPSHYLTALANVNDLVQSGVLVPCAVMVNKNYRKYLPCMTRQGKISSEVLSLQSNGKAVAIDSMIELCFSLAHNIYYFPGDIVVYDNNVL